MQKLLCLKVDVDTWKGTRDGVPALIDLFKKHEAGATFLFSVGPDHTGRAIRRVFRKGFFSKVKRTSVVEHYGFPTLLYGTLLPGPDIGNRGAVTMRRTRDEGFEVGIHCFDHVRWQDGVAHADAEWTRREMEAAQNRFIDIFKEPARTHGAAGWQMNKHAFRLTQELGFDYCSDGRASGEEGTPHFPVVNGEIINCPQLPSTLPTLDEVIGLNDVSSANVDQAMLDLTRESPRRITAATEPLSAHVFTLHAELEGLRLLSAFERMLIGWKEQGYTLVSTRTLYEKLVRDALPYFAVDNAEIEGRSGTLTRQGRPYLPEPLPATA